MNKEKVTSKGHRDILIILVAAVLMTVAAIIQYVYMRNSIIDSATECAKSDLTISKQNIETEVTAVETAVNTMASIIQNYTYSPDAAYDVTLRITKDNPIILRSVLAFPKGYFAPQKDSIYAPCSYRVAEGFNRTLVADYLNQPWYTEPAMYRKPQWCEPYVEKEAKGLLATYSCPVTDKQGRLIAVLAATVPVDSLTKTVNGVKGYPSSYAVLQSSNGHDLLGNDKDVSFEGAHTFSSTIGKVGWKLTMVCPDEDINNKTLTARIVVLAMQVLGLLLLLFIVINTFIQLKRLNKTTKERDRMGSELSKAQGIQEAMQKEKTSLPQDSRLQIEARLRNASEIGGDFYDCFIEGNKLYFCIGDVAGKGAPAALLMSMVRSVFRVSARHHTTCADIIAETNRLICKMNDGKTTIKMTGGILDLATGSLHFCNAGMHTPFLLRDTGVQPLGIASTKRIGVSADTAYDEENTTLIEPTTLFLYTDGLTEVENRRHEQWGEKRLNSHLNTNLRMNPKELLERIDRTLDEYTAGVLLPDDLTILAIKYMPE